MDNSVFVIRKENVQGIGHSPHMNALAGVENETLASQGFGPGEESSQAAPEALWLHMALSAKTVF